MNGQHLLAFALGILVGWLVVPLVLSLIGGKTTQG